MTSTCTIIGDIDKYNGFILRKRLDTSTVQLAFQCAGLHVSEAARGSGGRGGRGLFRTSRYDGLNTRSAITAGVIYGSFSYVRRRRYRDDPNTGTCYTNALSNGIVAHHIYIYHLYYTGVAKEVSYQKDWFGHITIKLWTL
jgi:hypothetical protein